MKSIDLDLEQSGMLCHALMQHMLNNGMADLINGQRDKATEPELRILNLYGKLAHVNNLLMKDER